MNFINEKPIAFIKVHTTGLDTKTDRIVSITISKHMPDGTQKSGKRMINPECHIPNEATAIHGITNEMIDGEKTFDQLAKGLFDFINDSDLVGFNVKFDIEMLMSEFSRAGLDYTVHSRNVIDLYELYVKMNPRDFKSAVKQYTGESISEGKVIDTDEFVGFCKKVSSGMFHGENPIDLNSEAKKLGVNTKTLDIRGFFVLNEDNRPIFNVGKHKGKIVSDVLLGDPSYYEWMKSDKSGLPKDVLLLAEKIIKKAKSVNA